MSKNNANEQVVENVTVSTEVSEVTTKSVIAALYGDAALSDDKREMTGSYGTRTSSGFDRLDRSAKVAVKKAVQARFDHLMRNGQFVLSQPLWDVLTSLSGSAAKSVSSEVTEESVKSAVAEKVALLRYAADALFAGSVPITGWDGISPILDESDIPEVTDEMVEKALKFASVTIGAKRKENDIPAMLRETVETLNSGQFYATSAIRNKMAEIYPNKAIDSSWDGRLSAALFGPNWDESLGTPISAKSVEAFEADEKGRAGLIVA